MPADILRSTSAALRLDPRDLVFETALAAREIGLPARQLLEVASQVGQRAVESLKVRSLGQVGASVPELVEPSVRALEREKVGLGGHGATVTGGPPPCGVSCGKFPFTVIEGSSPAPVGVCTAGTCPVGGGAVVGPLLRRDELNRPQLITM